MNAVEDVVSDIIKQWNKDVLQAGRTEEFILKVDTRVKEFYINRKDTYKQRIAEISLICKGEPTLLLWRKELRMPEKVKKTPQHQVDEAYIRELYFYFLYECIGVFTTTCRQMILDRDYAEYDIDKDRLKAHESGDGMIVETINEGTFYTKGNEFDVFMCTDDNYFVYTAHDYAKSNNGIAKIPKEHIMVKELAKTKIILLNDL